jgi:hypothetical protein
VRAEVVRAKLPRSIVKAEVSILEAEDVHAKQSRISRPIVKAEAVREKQSRSVVEAQ